MEGSSFPLHPGLIENKLKLFQYRRHAIVSLFNEMTKFL